MTLYSLRTAPTGFAITKFDDDFNPVATYHLEPKGFSYLCDCPANSRPIVTKPCRHKQMMPNLLPYADTDKFFDYDTGEFCTMLGDPHRVPPEEGEAQPLVGEAVHAETPVEALSRLVGFDVTNDSARPPEALGSPAEPPRSELSKAILPVIESRPYTAQEINKQVAIAAGSAPPKPYRQQIDELFAPPVVAPAQPLVIRRR